jgi:cell division protein FtsL
LRKKRKRYYRKSFAQRKIAKGIWSRWITYGLLVLLFAALGHVWQRVTVLKLTRDVKKLSEELVAVEKKYKYLSIEMASLNSVERIESIAMNELGLTYPQPEKVIYLNEPLVYGSDKQKDSFVLFSKFKRIAENFLLITEERLEAKEIKHDL